MTPCIAGSGMWRRCGGCCGVWTRWLSSTACWGEARVSGRVSVGTYLALAALNRVCDPRSKAGFAGWWATTALGRMLKIPAGALDHRRFWDAMDLVAVEQLDQIEAALT